MKNKADKAIPLELVPVKYIDTRQTVLLAHIMYDVEKLRRVSHDELTEILFEKTIKLYPFASVDKIINYLDMARKTALIPVWLHLSPGLHLKKVSEEE